MQQNSNWPTEHQDLETAADIIEKYVELNEGDPLGFIEVVVDRRDRTTPVKVRMPEWIRELMLHFQDQYGPQEGQAVASKVLTRVLLKSETVH